MNTKKISIIGAGWLGKPLSHTFYENDWDVIATNQIQKKSHNLQVDSANSNIDSTLEWKCFSSPIFMNDEMNSSELKEIFEQRVVIITIPPTPFLKAYPSEQQAIGIQDYESFIAKITLMAERYQAKHLYYTSSTSVYGNSSGIINEELPTMPKTSSAKAIVSAEKTLKNGKTPVTILRLAGLIGNGRHPIFSLQGRNSIRSPFNAINLLHIDDLISAIQTLVMRHEQIQLDKIQIDKFFEIYNIVTPTHPNRKSYYQAIARYLNLPIPTFEDPKPELKRIIDGGKITEQGDFSYKILDLVHASLEKIQRTF
ncbi:NAD-dependent epimerase/dehydratase family protein [Ignatzschineria sp. LJL83]